MVESPGSGPCLIKADFDDELMEAANKVARDFGLPDDWLNCGPTNQLDTGLPTGLQERLISKEYGENLVVFYCSRLDLIHLKLYAAVDLRGRHLEDLKSMNPEPDEIEQAASWCLSLDVSEPFSRLLEALLEELGYGAVIERLPQATV